jgi:hypothetical protein
MCRCIRSAREGGAGSNGTCHTVIPSTEWGACWAAETASTNQCQVAPSRERPRISLTWRWIVNHVPACQQHISQLPAQPAEPASVYGRPGHDGETSHERPPHEQGTPKVEIAEPASSPSADFIAQQELLQKTMHALEQLKSLGPVSYFCFKSM